MHVYRFGTVEESYGPLISHLLSDGVAVNPRGQMTRELTPVSVVIDNPRQNVIACAARRLNYGFMNAELMWILGGGDAVDDIAWYNGTWRIFSDDGVTLNGAYGRRIRRFPGPTKEVDQLAEAVAQLKADPLSRQATVVLFHPELDYRVTKDKPCTNLMRFKIRDNRLQMITFMRSNDVMLGYPYDVFNFTSLQAVVASRLGVELGTYTHIVDSLHIYERDLAWGQAIVDELAATKPGVDRGIYADGVLPNTCADIDDRLQGVRNVAASTRTLGDKLELATVLRMVDGVQDPYWRSTAAVLALYNLRKHHRPQADLDQVKARVTSEFRHLLGRYTELAK